MTLNFLTLTFLAEELTIPQYVAPAVISALAVLAILMVLVCGSSRWDEGRRAGTTLAGAGDGTVLRPCRRRPLCFASRAGGGVRRAAAVTLA